MSGDGQGALIAEVSMLRAHARRDADRRRARQRAAPPRHQRKHGGETSADWHWRAGEASAMRAVIDIAAEAVKRTDSLECAMRDVTLFAAGVIEVRSIEFDRPDWMDEEPRS